MFGGGFPLAAWDAGSHRPSEWIQRPTGSTMPRRNANDSGFRSLTDQLHDTMFAQAVAPASRACARPTSRRAARLAAPRAPSIATRALAEIGATVTGLTPDEAALRAKADEIGVRARCSQMRGRGWLEGTDLVRTSSHGGPQEVLTITDAGRAELARRTPGSAVA
jgi:hypothetical protein